MKSAGGLLRGAFLEEATPAARRARRASPARAQPRSRARARVLAGRARASSGSSECRGPVPRRADPAVRAQIYSIAAGALRALRSAVFDRGRRQPAALQSARTGRARRRDRVGANLRRRAARSWLRRPFARRPPPWSTSGQAARAAPRRAQGISGASSGASGAAPAAGGAAAAAAALLGLF